MNLHSFPSREEARDAATATLSTLLMNLQTDTLLLASGGSCLDILSSLSLERTTFWPHLTIGLVDERITPDTQARNLTALMRTSFYQHAIDQGAHVLEWHQDALADLETLARRYDDVLSAWRDHHPQGTVIITQGMGTDGHTAGIMPFAEDPAQFAQLFDDGASVVGYDAGGKNPFPRRVTVSLSFLRTQVNHSIAFIAGEEKRPALERLQAPTGTLAETPARIMREMKNSEVNIYLPHRT